MAQKVLCGLFLALPTPYSYLPTPVSFPPHPGPPSLWPHKTSSVLQELTNLFLSLELHAWNTACHSSHFQAEPSSFRVPPSPTRFLPPVPCPSPVRPFSTAPTLRPPPAHAFLTCHICSLSSSRTTLWTGLVSCSAPQSCNSTWHRVGLREVFLG